MKELEKILKHSDLPHHEMILVEGGTFMMGNDDKAAFEEEQPVHKVKLPSFYTGKYPVTQGLWKAVMGKENNPSRWPDDDRRPVERVSWKDAQEFIKELNKRTGQYYRLPTEAEWEYAARGGNKSRAYKYAGSNKIDEVAWYENNSHKETKPVGLKLPNKLGLYDMSGNVQEWCEDWFLEVYYQECHDQWIVENPRGPKVGTFRVLRGGGWNYDLQVCRSTCRSNHAPGDRSSIIGFRLVLSLG